jgi:HD-like signal output (HDOD) protein
MIFIIATILILAYVLYRHLLKPQKKSHFSKKLVNRNVSSKQILQKQIAQKPLLPVIDLTMPQEIPLALLEFKIMSLSESNQETISHIIKIYQSTSRPPHPMLHALSKGIEDSEELYQLVKSAPEIAAKILKTVNSSEFYLTQKITRLNHAILYLGTNMVKNIALQCVIGTKMKSANRQLNIAYKKIWANGFLASSLAFIFAKNLGLENAAELATQSLLAYIGNLAIISYEPQFALLFGDNVSLFDRVKIEQKKLNANSAIIGSFLAVEWDLPQQIVEGIRDNLIPLERAAEHPTLEITNLRNIIVCYICCRYAEIIINKGLRDIAEVNLLDKELLELFYLPEYIKLTGLQPLVNLVHKPIVRSEVNKLIAKITPSQKQGEFPP